MTQPAFAPPGGRSPKRIHETRPRARAAVDGMTDEEKNYYQVMVIRLLHKLADYVESQKNL